MNLDIDRYHKLKRFQIYIFHLAVHHQLIYSFFVLIDCIPIQELQYVIDIMAKRLFFYIDAGHDKCQCIRNNRLPKYRSGMVQDDTMDGR